MKRCVVAGISAAILVGACDRGPRPAPAAPANRADPDWAPALAVSADHVIGWIGVAPAYLPVATGAAAVVHADAIDLSPGVEAIAVPIGGDPVSVRSAAVQTFKFGCDDGHIELQPFDGTTLASGPVWVVPTPMPDGWDPAAIPLRTIDAAADRATWEAGPLSIVVTRTDDSHATLTIRAGQRTLHQAALDKPAMEGGDGKPIDLSEPGEPGISTPVAVYAIAPGGPALVVLSTHGYEGYSLSTLLVDGDGATEVDRLGFYVYQCAF